MRCGCWGIVCVIKWWYWLIVGMAFLRVVPLHAHAQLISAEPAIGSTLDFYPTELKLTFDQPIDPLSNVRLLADNFKTIDLSQQQAANVLIAQLPPLQQGVYTVQFDVISADGDIVRGSYEFAVVVPVEFEMLTSPWLLATYFLLFLFVIVGWRVYRVWQLSGVNALTRYRTEGVHGFASTIFRLVFVATTIVLLINALFPSARPYLVPITWLETAWLPIVGWALLLSAFVVIVFAQVQMGTAWRIGIDVEQKSKLVTHGIFRYSRNPIFLGIRLCFFGLFLILPNAFTLLLWVLEDVMIQVQVLLEEAYLAETFGASYVDYMGRVRRWI